MKFGLIEALKKKGLGTKEKEDVSSDVSSSSYFKRNALEALAKKRKKKEEEDEDNMNEY